MGGNEWAGEDIKVGEKEEAMEVSERKTGNENSKLSRIPNPAPPPTLPPPPPPHPLPAPKNEHK